MSYRTTIEKVLSYLFKNAKNIKEHQSQIEVLDLLNEITEDVVSGVDYALIKFVNNLYKILIGVEDYSLSIPLDSIERILESSISTLVYDKKFKVEDEIRENGLSYDLSNPKSASDVISYFYDEMITSIKTIYEIEVEEVQARAELASLVDQISDVLFRTSSIAQGVAYNKDGLDKGFEVMQQYFYRILNLKDIDIYGSEVKDIIRLTSFEESEKFDRKTRGKKIGRAHV